MKRLGLAVSSLALCAASAAVPEPLTTNNYTLFGTPGLIEMPTAEMLPDAEFAITASRFGEDLRNTLTFQITPRLVGSFRYAKLPEFNPNTNTTRFDRSFDIRFQFADEGKYRPALAIGLQDFVGTGVYSAEYLVATKSFGPKVRVTAGLGWGRLGTFGSLGAPIGDRPPIDIGRGGNTNEEQWFQGDVAPFGGITYQASERLTFKAEYSSDAYEFEEGEGLIDRQTPWNFGVDYAFKSGVRLGASYNYGDRLGLQVTVPVNPKRASAGPGNEEAPLPVAVRAAGSAEDLGWAAQPGAATSLQASVAGALSQQGIALEAMALDAQQVEVRISNLRYKIESQAIGRTARILSRTLPASVETFVITPVDTGVPTAKITFQRADLEALEHAPADAILERAVFTDAAGRRPDNLQNTPGLYPRFTFGIAPYIDRSFFDPDSPIRAELGLEASAKFQPAPGLVFSGAVKGEIIGNIDEITREANSRLEPVRTSFPEYSRASDVYLDELTAAYFVRPGRNLYGRVTAGYLERMFGGVSGEVLWKPVDSRLAVGAELNYARQRDFDGEFGFQDYDVWTGHASLYYDFGQGYLGQVDVGRYLAGDEGATVRFAREFANGWKVGAFATLTNVSAEDFGEGSFDKGINFEIPLQWAIGQPTRTKFGTTIRPTTRDGGARLRVKGRLYERVRDDHRPEVAESWGRFWR